MMKEKSKNAAKTRREKEKVEFQELARLLPLPDAISGQLDKASVIRLATAFLRLRRLLLESSEHTPTARNVFPIPQSMTAPFPTPSSQPCKSLTDSSNTGFAQPKLQATTPPPCSTPFDHTDNQTTGKFNGSFQTGQQLAQALDGFLMVIGADGKLIYVSEAASLHLGLSQVEMTGQPIGEYINPDDHAELASLINCYKSQLLSVHNQQDFRIPVSFVLRMKCVLAKRNAGIVHGGMKVIHCVGYIRSIPPAPTVQSSSIWPSGQRSSGHYVDPYTGVPGIVGATSPSLGNGIFIEDRNTNDDERDGLPGGSCRTSSSAGSGTQVPSPSNMNCASPPLPSFAPFAMFLVGCSVPPASATELRLASSSLFMLRTTLDMKLLFVETPRVTELLGYEPQDLIEKNLYNLIHCDDLRSFRACHHLLLMKGQCVTSYYRVLTRDGGWVWVQSVQTIVSNSRSSRPHCIVSVNHVISQDQHIFSSSTFPPASFLPRCSTGVKQPSFTNLPDLCMPPDLLSQRNIHLVVPSPRSLAVTNTTLVKPAAVQAPSLNSTFQPTLETTSNGFRSVGFAQPTHSSKAVGRLTSDETSQGFDWQSRQLQTSTDGSYLTSPFQHTRSSYQNYHAGGFSHMSQSMNGTEFLGSGDYSFFNKTSSAIDAWNNNNSEYTPSTTAVTPVTPMTPSLLHTPAPTPGASRFGSDSSSTTTNAASCQQQVSSNGQANSLQLVGGIHAHTINYTLHIENFNASANANSGAASTNSSHSGTSLANGMTPLPQQQQQQQQPHATPQPHQQQQHQQQSEVGNRNGGIEPQPSQPVVDRNEPSARGTAKHAESVASAVASATAGLVLGAAPTTVVMCNQQQQQPNATATSTASSCWFDMQQSSNNTSGYFSGAGANYSNHLHLSSQHQQLQQQNRHLTTTSLSTQTMKNGHLATGVKRSFNGTSNSCLTGSSPFSSMMMSPNSAQAVSVIQPSNGVIEPIAKRIVPTQAAWLHQQPQS